MRSRIRVLGVLGLSVTFALAACGDDATKDPVKIALLAPTSGALDFVGDSFVRVAEAAVAEINANGGANGHQIELVVKDTETDANVAPDKFIEAVEEYEAPILGMSALLTTTMPNMGKTIEAFIDEDLREDVKIMVGGAPVTQEFADDMGADGYGKDALECVALAKRFIEEGDDEEF